MTESLLSVSSETLCVLGQLMVKMSVRQTPVNLVLPEVEKVMV